MNKWLVSMSAAAVAAGAMAVESANTVGVITHDIDPNVPVDNVGVCLVPVGDASGSFSVTNEAFGQALSAGDSFYEFNPGLWDFDIYTYNGSGQGWSAMYADSTGASIDGLTVSSPASLFYMGASQTFTMTGQVRASGTQTLTFSPGVNDEYVFPIANPYPIATTFADLETFCSTGDTIYLFNPGLWDFDIYTYNGSGQGWSAMYADSTAETLNDSSAVILAAGQGASFMPNSQCTWTVSLNY